VFLEIVNSKWNCSLKTSSVYSFIYNLCSFNKLKENCRKENHKNHISGPDVFWIYCCENGSIFRNFYIRSTCFGNWQLLETYYWSSTLVGTFILVYDNVTFHLGTSHRRDFRSKIAIVYAFNIKVLDNLIVCNIINLAV